MSFVGGFLQGRSERKAQKRQARNQRGAINEAREIRERLQQEAQDGTFAGRFGLEDIFGSTPDELDLSASINQALSTNQGNRATIDQLVGGFNDDISAEALNRAVRFDPNFRQNLSTLSDSARSLLRGEIPIDVRDQLVRNRAELTALNGVAGTGGAATSRDLGLTSLDLQNRGQSFFQQVNSIRDQIDPLSRHIQRQQFLLDPGTQVAVDQSNNAIRSLANPGASGLFQLDLQGSREEALAKGNVTVPTASPLASAFGAAANTAAAFGGGFSNPFQFGAPRAALPVNQFGK